MINWEAEWKVFTAKFNRVTCCRYTVVTVWFLLSALVVSSWGNEPDGLKYKLWENIINFTNPSWQLVAIFIFCYLVAKYEIQIGKILNRIQKVGSLVELAPDQSQPPQLSEGLSDNVSVSNNLASDQLELPLDNEVDRSASSTPLIKNIIDNLISELDRRYSSLDPQTRLKLLAYYFATERIKLWSEQVFRQILGSQIMLLKKIREHGGTLHSDFVSMYFDNVRKKDPDIFGNWNAQSYTRFLLTSNLLNLNPQHIYQLTEFGAHFLFWLEQSGFSEKDKAL